MLQCRHSNTHSGSGNLLAHIRSPNSNLVTCALFSILHQCVSRVDESTLVFALRYSSHPLHLLVRGAWSSAPVRPPLPHAKMPRDLRADVSMPHLLVYWFANPNAIEPAAKRCPQHRSSTHQCPLQTMTSLHSRQYRTARCARA